MPARLADNGFSIKTCNPALGAASAYRHMGICRGGNNGSIEFVESHCAQIGEPVITIVSLRDFSRPDFFWLNKGD